MSWSVTEGGPVTQGRGEVPPALASQALPSCCGESRAQAVGTRKVSQAFPGSQLSEMERSGHEVY